MDDTTGLTSGSGGGKRVMLPAWFVKHRRAGFAILINVCITILALACAVHAKKDNKTSIGGARESVGAYVFALIVSLITLPIEWAVDRRNPEMTKDLRFDLAGALIALAIIRLESTRQIGGYSLGEGTPCRGMYFETENTHFQVAIDVFFFISFLGAKLVGRTGSRELAMLVMADIVDFIELTFSMANFQSNDGGITYQCTIANKISGSTCNAIAAFTFIFALVTLLLQRAEGPGQKALNSLVQGLFVHIPLIAIRLAIPLSESNQTSFNLIFIVKNIVELVACIMDFLDAGSEVRNGGGSGDYDNLT